MTKIQKLVIGLLILTIVLSVVSIVFNFIIYKMSSDNSKSIKQFYSSNSGNIGLIVEGSNNIERGSGG
ncbi:MAG: hypothetical protein AABW89_03085 [Nanoarchaeota archaeon]